MSEKFRKNKKFTVEEKQKIIDYIKVNGITSVKAKFDVWPETVRYWIDADHRKKVKESVNNRIKTDDQKERDKNYREYRSKLGLSGEYWQDWYSNLSEEQRDYNTNRVKQHRLDNIDHYKNKAKKRYLRDKEKGLYRKRYNEDPLYKMKCNIREHVRQAIKYSNLTKDHPSIKYLGCTIEEFKVHIESQFVEGMSWDNHSRGENCWHLDHIKPLASLKDIADTETLKAVCHYTNYQPLWEKDNLSKQDKYEE